MPDTSTNLILLSIAGVMLVGGLFYWWRENRILRSWAEQNGYTILRKESSSSPMWDDGGDEDDHRAYYRLTVQEPSGRIRHCWVRLGGYFWGLLSRRLDVCWEEPSWKYPPSPAPRVPQR